MTCGKPGCQQEAQHSMSGGKTYYCTRHARFARMITASQSRGKYVPSWEELEAIVPQDMVCPVCNHEMFWLAKESGYAATMTLQHWSDGSLSFICLSCNARDGNLNIPKKPRASV